MIERDNLISLKEVYINLLEDTDFLSNKIKYLKFDLEKIQKSLNLYYLIDDKTGDDELIKKIIDELIQVKSYINFTLKNEIIEKIIELNQQINS